MRAIIAAIIAALVTLAGAALVDSATRPTCPTEDSCTVDYRNGQWQIAEVTP